MHPLADASAAESADDESSDSGNGPRAAAAKKPKLDNK
jgi:hypothetical protein